MATPAGQIWLLKNMGWSKDYKHTRYFANATDQHNWICHRDRWAVDSGMPKTGQNYIKDPLHGSIRVEGHQENYLDASYMCFQNTDIYESPNQPYVYAFIDDCRFVNNNVMEFDYTVDVLQTYLISGKCSVTQVGNDDVKQYIKRTHVQLDQIGNHIEPEPVTFGTKILSEERTLVHSGSDLLVFATEPYEPDGHHDDVYSPYYGARINGLWYIICPTVITSSQFKAFCDYVKDNSGYRDSIISMTVIPDGLVEAVGHHDNVPFDYLLDTSDLSSLDQSKSISIKEYEDAMDGVSAATIYNKKLFTYPYNNLVLTDGGAEIEIEYEKINTDFSGDNAQPKLEYREVFALTPTPACSCILSNYALGTRGDYNYSRQITLNDYAQVPWSGTAFSSWLNSQGISSAVSVLTGAIGGAIVGGGIPGAIAGAGAGALGVVGQGAAQAVKPDKANGAFTGSTLQSIDEYNVHAFRSCLCREDVIKIDNFFSRYGYGVETTDKIHFTNKRFNQHYVQTQNCVCYGGAPASAIKTIQDAFDNGITFWKNDVGVYDGIH